MLSRFCKLCHNRLDVPVVNLRRYKVSSTLLEKHDDEDTPVPKVEDRIPIIIAKRPVFNFYKGKQFTKFETIPIASQGWHHLKSAGDHFTIHPIQNMVIEGFEDPDEPKTLDDFFLHPKLIENLRENNIQLPTEIQINAVPKITRGQHTILSAETGSGKTFAFLLPILNHILKWKTMKEYRDRGPNRPFAMIVTPSHELSLQIAKEAEKLLTNLDISIKVLRSTKARAKMMNPSIRDVDVLIGTFGILSKMVTTKIYKLDHVKHVVLDEAHALFHETFDEKLEVFLRRITFHSGVINDDPNAPTGAQLTLVSATKPSEMPEYLNDVLDIQSLVNISTKNFHRVMVPQKFIRVALPDKPMTLLKLVKPKAMKQQRIIVFSNDCSTSNWISLFFNEFNIRAVHLHGDMPMFHRKDKFMSFQRGDFNVLSTTNVGARGLDTLSVNTVINYDLPMETADYIHRCGRTGRIGSKVEGRVLNFISRSNEIELTQKIERAARRMRPIPILNLVEEKAKRQDRLDSNFDILSKPSRKSRKLKKSRKPRKGAKERKKKARKASV